MLITDKKLLQNYVASKRIWQGIPSIEVTAKGRKFVTFYSGETKEEIGNFVVLVKCDDEKTYSEPVAVCFEEDHRCFDPCVWIDPLKRLWLTWSRCPGDGLYGAICENPDADEIVFGEEFFIGNTIMMNKPTVLSTGEWAFPLAVWDEGVRVIPEENSSKNAPGSHMYITDDYGQTFKKVGSAYVKNRSFDEHIFLEMKNESIRVFVRTAYGIGAADSYDYGRHWGSDFDTGYGGPSSRFCIRRLKSGRVLLINHYKYTGRNNLTAMLSDDDGKTFPYKLLIDERNDVSYPDAAIGPDGSIYITYDRERGASKSSLEDAYKCAREILIARITEEDILNGKIVNENSYLKHICSKLGEYDGDKNIYDNKLISHISKIGNVEDVIDALFDEYNINCTNIHNVDATLLDNLVENYKNDRNEEVLAQIIVLVKNTTPVKKVANSKNVADKELVDKICEYIKDNVEINEEVKEIAERFNYSYNYIQHIFKKHTGTNIRSYRLTQRLSKAKELLRGNGHKITDVALECGFENSSYFTEMFRREEGITPSEYQNKHKKRK